MKALNVIQFKVKKYSPEILLTAGVVGVAASAIMACKASTKASKIMEETNKNLETIKKCKDENEEDVYSEADYRKDLTITYTQTIKNFVKLYGPAVLIGTTSIFCILASHGLMRKRNVAISAAYATLNKGFSDYRKRAVEKFGEKVDKELRYGVSTEEVEETITDEKGKEKKVKKTIEVVNAYEHSPYAKFFDATSREWNKDPEVNLMFLRAQEKYANDLLRARGYLFLNEVYDMLDIPKTREGQIVGWVYDPEGTISDGYVDFGIYETNRNERFVNGYEPVVLLDFNVDGNVLDLIPW